MGQATLSGKRQWTRIGWRQSQEIHRGRRRSRRTSETPQDTWLGRARKGSLWLCCTRPLAERERKVGSQVIGDDRSRLPGRRTAGKVRGGER